MNFHTGNKRIGNEYPYIITSETWSTHYGVDSSIELLKMSTNAIEQKTTNRWFATAFLYDERIKTRETLKAADNGFRCPEFDSKPMYVDALLGHKLLQNAAPTKPLQVGD